MKGARVEPTSISSPVSRRRRLGIAHRFRWPPIALTRPRDKGEIHREQRKTLACTRDVLRPKERIETRVEVPCRPRDFDALLGIDHGHHGRGGGLEARHVLAETRRAERDHIAYGVHQIEPCAVRHGLTLGHRGSEPLRTFGSCAHGDDISEVSIERDGLQLIGKTAGRVAGRIAKADVLERREVDRTDGVVGKPDLVDDADSVYVRVEAIWLELLDLLPRSTRSRADTRRNP